jgi:hypothetical protein
VILALVMRFEFVGGFFGKLIRVAEIAVLLLLLYQFWLLLIV